MAPNQADDRNRDYEALAAKWGAAAIKAFRENPREAVLVGAVGGLIGFFAAGTYGAAKGMLVGASVSGEFARVPGHGQSGEGPVAVAPIVQTATTEFRAYRPAAPGDDEELPAPFSEPTNDPTSVVWIRSHQGPKPEHLMADAWFLEVDGDYFGLAPGHEYEVGRDDEADIRIQEKAHKGDTVSRRHARIGVFAGALYVSDSGSRNGTWIRGKQLLQGEVYRAHHRTAIQLGKFVLVVRPAVRTADGG